MIKFVLLLPFSIVCFVLGYNFIFNTNKTISKFVLLARYEEGSKFYNILKSKSNAIWMKICGVFMIVFALALLLVGVIRQAA